jgi:hypothetical protein
VGGRERGWAWLFWGGGGGGGWAWVKVKMDLRSAHRKGFLNEPAGQGGLKGWFIVESWCLERAVCVSSAPPGAFLPKKPVCVCWSQRRALLAEGVRARLYPHGVPSHAKSWNGILLLCISRRCPASLITHPHSYSHSYLHSYSHSYLHSYLHSYSHSYSHSLCTAGTEQHMSDIPNLPDLHQALQVNPFVFC